jgi:DUF4097 and DUF4098 domain-containing protein YvlB
MRRRPLPRCSGFAVAIALAVATPIAAQSDRASRFMDSCRRNNWNDYVQVCEVRDFTIAGLRGLVVDGRANGGISVYGWDRSDIKVVALVQAQAESEVEANDIARQIDISTNNGEIRAAGPTRNRRHESWSVSYEIYAPRRTELALTATNGGISVEGIQSRMDLETSNGGLNLTDVDGDVRGRTTNGGVTARLNGERWRGAGLDLRTSNGGVTLYVPENYSARLETGTVNGGLNLGFPIAVQGNVGRRITTQLGSGGATISATTTNGGVTIRRR